MASNVRRCLLFTKMISPHAIIVHPGLAPGSIPEISLSVRCASSDGAHAATMLGQAVGYPCDLRPSALSTRGGTAMTATATARTYQNYIGGEWADSSSGATSEDRNPARPSEVLGRFQSSAIADVDRAMDAAHAALDGWRKMSPVARGNILYKASQLVER